MSYDTIIQELKQKKLYTYANRIKALVDDYIDFNDNSVDEIQKRLNKIDNIEKLAGIFIQNYIHELNREGKIKLFDKSYFPAYLLNILDPSKFRYQFQMFVARGVDNEFLTDDQSNAIYHTMIYKNTFDKAVDNWEKLWTQEIF